MRIAVFSSKAYDREFLDRANGGRHELRFLEPRLSVETASLAGFTAVCVFVNDHLDAGVIETLASSVTWASTTFAIVPNRSTRNAWCFAKAGEKSHSPRRIVAT